jgi:cytochrome c biogenesis protein CcmG/thiol:disulfide interchange protein DsbE
MIIKLKTFFPLLILLAIITITTIATYKISAKKNIKNDEFALLNTAEIHLKEFSLPNLFDENKNFSNKSFTKKKLSIVNVFASWCTTCLAEHDSLFYLKEKSGVDLYGVAWRDFSENTKKYLEKNGNPFTEVALDSKGVFTDLIGVNAVPETFVIDENSRIVARYDGNINELALQELLQFIKIY